MRYLVRIIEPNSSLGPAEAKVFTSLPDAVKHIQKVNKSEYLFMQEKEGTLEQLERFLAERLATVFVGTHPGKMKQWMITAFD